MEPGQSKRKKQRVEEGLADREEEPRRERQPKDAYTKEKEGDSRRREKNKERKEQQ